MPKAHMRQQGPTLVILTAQEGYGVSIRGCKGPNEEWLIGKCLIKEVVNYTKKWLTKV